jgi:hypothetical protein
VVVGGDVWAGCVVGGWVVGGVGGGPFTTFTVVVGRGFVVGDAVVVECRDVVDVASGFVAPDLLDDPLAPAIPAISKIATTGAAIFAHNGQARTRSRAERDEDTPTAGMTAVSSHGEVETGSVGATDSGGYHLPSDPTHQPGSFGSWSSGPRGFPVTLVNRPGFDGDLLVWL